jgi:hypothetical protein
MKEALCPRVGGFDGENITSVPDISEASGVLLK